MPKLLILLNPAINVVEGVVRVGIAFKRAAELLSSALILKSAGTVANEAFEMHELS